MVELRGVSAGYKKGEARLHAVSHVFEAGCFTGLIGPNGCGKSTLIKLLCGLLRPFDGTVLLDGLPTSTLSRKLFAKKVALLPQARETPSISVRALVLHGRFPHLGYPRSYSPRDYELADQAMERTGVSAYAGRNVASLSGGERQRVYLAMAIAQDTPILLLDEPATYLDIAHQLELLALTRELCTQGKTVIMAMHDLSAALSRCDRLLLLEEGYVRATGVPGQVYASGEIERVFGVRVHQIEQGRHYLFEQREADACGQG